MSSGGAEPVIDFGPGDFLQEHRLPHQVDGIFLPEHRFGQPREGGEFVDHLPQVADLADDRAGQFLEQLDVLFDLLAIAPVEPLGGELDRGQRVLDLVGDAPRDVRPGRLPLVDQLARDILESDDPPVRGRSEPDRKRQQFALLALLDQSA